MSELSHLSEAELRIIIEACLTVSTWSGATVEDRRAARSVIDKARADLLLGGQVEVMRKGTCICVIGNSNFLCACCGAKHGEPCRHPEPNEKKVQ